MPVLALASGLSFNKKENLPKYMGGYNTILVGNNTRLRHVELLLALTYLHAI